MKPACFAYHRPTALEQALDLLARWAPDGGRLLAGGQSLVPLMALRLAQPPHLIDINRLAFPALCLEDGALVVSATVRHAAMAAAPGPLGPALATVAAHVAHLPIRSRGTVCGSLAHADPAAEWPLVAATLGGTAIARSARGERRIAADAFVTDVMTTALAEDEMLTELRLAVPPRGARIGFNEVSRRAGDYAMAACFAVLAFDGPVVAAARVGVGGAERRPRRIAAAEAALVGARFGAEAVEAAAAAAAAAIDPMQDAQVGPALRRDLVRASVRRALRSAA